MCIFTSCSPNKGKHNIRWGLVMDQDIKIFYTNLSHVLKVNFTIFTYLKSHCLQFLCFFQKLRSDPWNMKNMLRTQGVSSKTRWLLFHQMLNTSRSCVRLSTSIMRSIIFISWSRPGGPVLRIVPERRTQSTLLLVKNLRKGMDQLLQQLQVKNTGWLHGSRCFHFDTQHENMRECELCMEFGNCTRSIRAVLRSNNTSNRYNTYVIDLIKWL